MRWTPSCGCIFAYIFFRRRVWRPPPRLPAPAPDPQPRYPDPDHPTIIYGKTAFITTAVLFALTGAILSGVGASDSDACINLKITSICGTIYTGIGILLAAVASYPL